MRNCIKRFDFFGGSIGFTFQGEHKFKTLCGGTCSLISLFFILAFYCMKFVEFVGKLDPKLTMIEYVNPVNSTFDLT